MGKKTRGGACLAIGDGTTNGRTMIGDGTTDATTTGCHHVFHPTGILLSGECCIKVYLHGADFCFKFLTLNIFILIS